MKTLLDMWTASVKILFSCNKYYLNYGTGVCYVPSETFSYPKQLDINTRLSSQHKLYFQHYYIEWNGLGRQFILHLWCCMLFVKCFRSLCLLDCPCMKPTCLWLNPVIYLHTQVQTIWRGGIIAYKRISHPSNIKTWPPIGLLLIHLISLELG